MRHNDSLRTSNVILKELNETYYVTKPFSPSGNGDDYDFLVYDAPDGGGLDFIFGVLVKKGNKKKVIFNGVDYSDVETLLKDVETYNSSLMFPSKLYDPNYRKDFINRERISWYLENVLGMKFADYIWGSRGQIYKKTGIYGEEITNISFEVDEDGKGKIYRKVSGSSWVEMPFDTVSDAIQAINGILSPEICANVNDYLDMLGKMTSYGLSLKNAEAIKVNFSTLEVIHSDFRKQAIEKLEQVLEQLKAGQP